MAGRDGGYTGMAAKKPGALALHCGEGFKQYLTKQRVMDFSARLACVAGFSCCQKRTAWSELAAAGAATAGGSWWQENQARRKADSPFSTGILRYKFLKSPNRVAGH